MVRSPIPGDYLLVVGPTLHIYLRQPAEDALERIGILRCRLHHPHHRQHPDCFIVLCRALNRHEHSQHGHFGHLAH